MKIMVLLLAALALAPGCRDIHKNVRGSTLKSVESNITRVVFGFRDASVPPPYHRSYDLNVTNKEAELTIHSYGDKLHHELFDISSQRFDSFVKALTELHIESDTMKVNPGCTGGTTLSLELSLDKELLLEGWTYYCAGVFSGNLKGSLGELKPLMNKHFPEIERALGKVK